VTLSGYRIAEYPAKLHPPNFVVAYQFPEDFKPYSGGNTDPDTGKPFIDQFEAQQKGMGIPAWSPPVL
jgi:hypothetical protein